MEPIEATSLDDLSVPSVPVPLRRPDGQVVVVPLRPLTEAEVWAIRRATHWPKPPVLDMSKSGPIYDTKNEAYLAAVEDANRLFLQRTLLAMLPFVLPGETEDERLRALQARLGQTVYDQLVRAATKLNVITQEEIAALADSFRPLPAAGASAPGGAGNGAQPVAEALAGGPA